MNTLPALPKTIMLLGTDASGKNYVARLWARRLKEAGFTVALREGSLGGSAAQEKDHGEKGSLALLAERAFIVLFPITRWLLPAMAAVLMHLDARRFKPGDGHVLVVSHSALRVLAFCLGQNKHFVRQKKLPPWLERAILRLQEASNAMVLVLDVADDTRQQRIQRRLQEGSIDPFDQYMADNSERSECIEACLVHLAQHYYGAHLVENNDLSEDDLWEAFQKAWAAQAQQKST